MLLNNHAVLNTERPHWTRKRVWIESAPCPCTKYRARPRLLLLGGSLLLGRRLLLGGSLLGRGLHHGLLGRRLLGRRGLLGRRLLLDHWLLGRGLLDRLLGGGLLGGGRLLGGRHG